MAHLTRSRRKLNEWRKRVAKFKARPVPIEEQKRRHAERLAANVPEPYEVVLLRGTSRT